MVISTEGERVSENSLEEREGFTQVINFEEDDDEAFLTSMLDAKSLITCCCQILSSPSFLNSC